MSDQDTLTDRERILIRVIEQLSSTQLLGPGAARSWNSSAFVDSAGHHYTHFAYWDEPKPGDLVLAKTGGMSIWKIGFYVEKRPDIGGALIRPIGSDQVCEYGNESFVPIIGLSEIDLLEGDKREFYARLMAAFREGDEYSYRFGGLRFDGETAVVTIREVFGGMGAPSVPFNVRIKMRKNMAVKTILAKLRDGGYGSKSFRPEAASDSSSNAKEPK